MRIAGLRRGRTKCQIARASGAQPKMVRGSAGAAAYFFFLKISSGLDLGAAFVSDSLVFADF